MPKHSKRYNALAQKQPKQVVSLSEALQFLTKNTTTKFVESVDIAMNLGVDPKHADQMVRGVVMLPNGTGKTLRIAVFAKGAKAEEAKKAGADIVGGDELVDEILQGRMDFDRCIATPDMMIGVGKLGKVLGPRGLMPNPKLGTVTMDVTTAIKNNKGGQIEFKVDKNGVLHAMVGKVNFTVDQLIGNVKAVYQAVTNAKPSGAKGNYMKKVSISTTMGVGLELDITTISQ